MELFHAANQWANRPADERFDSLQEMYRATLQYAKVAGESVVPWTDLRVQAIGDDLMLTGKADVPAKLTNYAFGQLASRVGAPASYLRELPETLAANNLNFGLARKTDAGTDAQLLFHTNGSLLLRAATSTRYNRIWNFQVIERLMELCDTHDLIPARQTFVWGDEDGEIPEDVDRALYASDHDMFAFVMSPDRVVRDPVGQTLRRGVIVQNSEVGDKSLSFMGFLFRDVCANHIIWGAEQLAEVRFSHTGDVEGKFEDAVLTVRKYMDGAASYDEAQFQEFTARIGETKEDVVEALFRDRRLGLSKKAIEAGYEAVVPEEDGDPRSRWGIVQGLTRVSQGEDYAEDRVAMDRAAGKLLQVNF